MAWPPKMEKDERPMSLWALWWPERAATWLGCEELGAELGAVMFLLKYGYWNLPHSECSHLQMENVIFCWWILRTERWELITCWSTQLGHCFHWVSVKEVWPRSWLIEKPLLTLLPNYLISCDSRGFWWTKQASSHRFLAGFGMGPPDILSSWNPRELRAANQHCLDVPGSWNVYDALLVGLWDFLGESATIKHM